MSSPPLVDRLRAAGCVFAEDEARLLTEAAGAPGELAAMVARRVAGEPLEHVLGWVQFCGLRIAVGPGVFVPRRRTEFLAAQAAARLPTGGVAVDLCCGCGAVAAALLAAVPGIEVHAADLDPVAAEYARRNLPAAGVHVGDLYEALPSTLRGRVDVLVANVPYVPREAIALMPPEAREHEPRAALDGGADGLDIARRFFAEAPDWLAPGGQALVETSVAQAPALREAIRDAGLEPAVATSEELAATVAIGTLRPSGTVR